MDDVRLKQIGLQLTKLAAQMSDINEKIRTLKHRLAVTPGRVVSPFPDDPRQVAHHRVPHHRVPHHRVVGLEEDGGERGWSIGPKSAKRFSDESDAMT